ncbi:MAG: tetratricopeptide repeat protein [Deltaproteobacteria bacterium]|nr:MAG: tetratricopeptide repeat protein [Deltaproteobacteria bacterium]
MTVLMRLLGRCYSAAQPARPARVAAAFALAVAACGVSDDLDRADALARQHRWTEAVDAYEAVLARYPHSYAAAWGIARIYCVETHHYDKCLRWTDVLLDAYPDDVRYRRARAAGLRDRAAARRRAGDRAGAAADEAQAAALAP